MHLLGTTLKHLLVTKELCSHSRSAHMEKHPEFTSCSASLFHLQEGQQIDTLDLVGCHYNAPHETGTNIVTLRKSCKRMKPSAVERALFLYSVVKVKIKPDSCGVLGGAEGHA